MGNDYQCLSDSWFVLLGLEESVRNPETDFEVCPPLSSGVHLLYTLWLQELFLSPEVTQAILELPAYRYLTGGSR